MTEELVPTKCVKCGEDVLVTQSLFEWVDECLVCDNCPFGEPECEVCGEDIHHCECDPDVRVVINKPSMRERNNT